MRRTNELKEKGYLDFMSQDDYCKLVSKARDLQEDIQLMKLLTKRLGKSEFHFVTLPYQGLAYAFYRDLYLSYYKDALDELEIMLGEYEVVNHMMQELYAEKDVDVQVVVYIYKHFKEGYNMDLLDYVTSFIGCSLGSTGVYVRLNKILKEMRQDD